jgi:hypothetical protein
VSDGQTIYVVNRSTLVVDADVRTMTAAIDHQMSRDVEPAWYLPRTPITFTAAPPRGARVIVVVDTADDPQALGYHDEVAAIQSGVVGCKPELDQGAHPLTGPYSVASILSHEVLEMAVDPRCNLWADSGRGFLVALEVGDPTQSDHYDVDGVTVSSFVWPGFFDPNSPRGTKLDQLGLIQAPFTLRKGGYWVQLHAGQASQKFGVDMPAWLVAAKASNPSSRTCRRNNATGPADR